MCIHCPSSPSLSGPGSSSRLCKRALYSYFFKVAQQKYLLKLPTYYSVKVGATLIKSAKPCLLWLLSLMMSLLTGSSLRLPDSQKSGEATVSEQAWRTLELKEPGGLLQYWMSLQKFPWILCERVCDGDIRLQPVGFLSSYQLHHWRQWSREFVWTFWLNFCSYPQLQIKSRCSFPAEGLLQQQQICCLGLFVCGCWVYFK